MIVKKKVELHCLNCDARSESHTIKVVSVLDDTGEKGVPFDAELMANGWTSAQGGDVCSKCHSEIKERKIIGEYTNKIYSSKLIDGSGRAPYQGPQLNFVGLHKQATTLLVGQAIEIWDGDNFCVRLTMGPEGEISEAFWK